jgi:hypothetical protein
MRRAKSWLSRSRNDNPFHLDTFVAGLRLRRVRVHLACGDVPVPPPDKTDIVNDVAQRFKTSEVQEKVSISQLDSIVNC